MALDLPDYSKLNEMYLGPLAARMAQDNYDQKGQLAQMMLQQQQQKNEFDAQNNPLMLEHQRDINNEQTARLPGIYMGNAEKALQLDKASRTHEDEIDNLLSGYKGKKSQEELANLTRAGEMYNQAGAYLKTVPPAIAHATAKQILGSYYRPEFDQYPPEQLVKTVQDAGLWMTSAQTKYQQAMQKQDDQQAAREREIKLKADKAKELAQYKESIKKVAAAVVKTNDPKNWQDASTRLLMQAAQEPDQEKRDILVAQAQSFTDLIMAKERQKAAAAAETKPSLPGMGIQTNPPVAPPKVVMPGPTATVPAQPKPGSSPNNPIVLK